MALSFVRTGKATVGTKPDEWKSAKNFSVTMKDGKLYRNTMYLKMQPFADACAVISPNGPIACQGAIQRWEAR
jgi:hypothetical protein